MPFEPFQVLGAGLLGFASAASLRWWQYGRDLWIGQVTRFSDAAAIAADLATEYWQQEKVARTAWFISDDGKVCDLADAQKELLVLEAKLMGMQTRLDGLFASIEWRLSRADQAIVAKHLAEMRDALTGGAYKSSSREPDTQRAQLAQVAASDLLISIQSAANRALTIAGLLKYLNERAEMRQRIAIDGF